MHNSSVSVLSSAYEAPNPLPCTNTGSVSCQVFQNSKAYGEIYEILKSSDKAWESMGVFFICNVFVRKFELSGCACKRKTTKYVSRQTCLESTLSVGWHRPLHQSQMSLFRNILNTGLLRKNRPYCSHIGFFRVKTGFGSLDLILGTFAWPHSKKRADEQEIHKMVPSLSTLSTSAFKAHWGRSMDTVRSEQPQVPNWQFLKDLL